MALIDQINSLATRIATEVKGKASRTGGGREAHEVVSVSSGTLTLNLNNASVFSCSPSANITTLTISNIPASGTVATVTLILEQGGTPRTCANPSGTHHWMGITPGTELASKWSVRTFLTRDGGTTWVSSWSQEP